MWVKGYLKAKLAKGPGAIKDFQCRHAKTMHFSCKALRALHLLHVGPHASNPFEIPVGSFKGREFTAKEAQIFSQSLLHSNKVVVNSLEELAF